MMQGAIARRRRAKICIADHGWLALVFLRNREEEAAASQALRSIPSGEGVMLSSAAKGTSEVL